MTFQINSLTKGKLGMTDIHALIHQNKGIFRMERLKRKPLNDPSLQSLSEPISPDAQIIFWYPKDLAYETARWLAKDFAVDLKRDLSDYTK